MKDNAPLPTFTSVSIGVITDVITGNLIPMLVALDFRGVIWRKIAFKDWEELKTVREE